MKPNFPIPDGGAGPRYRPASGSLTKPRMARLYAVSIVGRSPILDDDIKLNKPSTRRFSRLRKVSSAGGFLCVFALSSKGKTQRREGAKKDRICSTSIPSMSGLLQWTQQLKPLDFDARIVQWHVSVEFVVPMSAAVEVRPFRPQADDCGALWTQSVGATSFGEDPTAPHPSAPAPVRGQLRDRPGKCRSRECRSRERNWSTASRRPSPGR